MMQRFLENKQYWLWGGTIVMAIICYNFAFRPTLSAWNLNKTLQNEQLDGGDNLSSSPVYIERKVAGVKQALEKFHTDTAFFRDNLVTQLSLISEKFNVQLTKVPPSGVNNYFGPKISLQKIQLSGKYFDLLKMLYEFEKKQGLGKVRSIEIINPPSNIPGDLNRNTQVMTVDIVAW